MQYLPRSSRYRRKSNKFSFKKLGTIVTLAVFLILLFLCVRYFSLFQALKGSASPAIWRPQEQERVQFLLAGRLNNEITSCTLLSVPASQDSPVHILRIPPATLLTGKADANDSLAALYGEQGIEATIMGIESLFANKMPIDHFVVYDVQKIADIVAEISGVTVPLPEEFFVSTEESDYIFKPGDNDIQAGHVIPFIAADSGYRDIDFWAEKSLLVEVFNQMFTLKHISYFVTNMSGVAEGYDSDMSPRQLAKFRDSLQALAWEERNFSLLPGSWLVSGEQRYWSCDQQLLEMKVNQIVNNIPGYDKTTLVVDVFNGNGITGFAANTANLLRGHMYNIGRVDNAEPSELTRIYYQKEYHLAAVEIALILDVEAVLIEDSYVDSENPVAVILGQDMRGR